MKIRVDISCHLHLDLINNYDDLHAENPDRYPDSNAKDLVNMVVPIQNHNLQLRGGSEKMKYFAGMGYYKQDGLFDQVNYSRYNYNINLESKVTKTTTVSLSVIGSIERTNDLDVLPVNMLFRSSGINTYLYNLFIITNGLWGQSGRKFPCRMCLIVEGMQKLM